MSLSLSIWLLCLLGYAVFHLWWGGRQVQPLSAAEVQAGIARLREVASGPNSLAHLDEVAQLLASDDGRSFVMFNAVLYRHKAQYPENAGYSDDPRQADQRYGRAIMWPLIKRACVPIFIARKNGRFVNDAQAPEWHYVAMVRYRSMRDFLKFAIEIEQTGAVFHKWAAIEQTHVFPVRPLISLFVPRVMVALVLTLLAQALTALV